MMKMKIGKKWGKNRSLHKIEKIEEEEEGGFIVMEMNITISF